jgi:hypothetical protein
MGLRRFYKHLTEAKLFRRLRGSSFQKHYRKKIRKGAVMNSYLSARESAIRTRIYLLGNLRERSFRAQTIPIKDFLAKPFAPPLRARTKGLKGPTSLGEALLNLSKLDLTFLNALQKSLEKAYILKEHSQFGLSPLRGSLSFVGTHYRSITNNPVFKKTLVQKSKSLASGSLSIEHWLATIFIGKDRAQVQKKPWNLAPWGSDAETFRTVVLRARSLQTRYSEDLYFQSAQFLADHIAQKIEGRQSLVQCINQILRNRRPQQTAKVRGLRISCKGRINGAEKAKVVTKRFGQTPTQTFSTNLDYGTQEVRTKYGVLGIKVWICF